MPSASPTVAVDPGVGRPGEILLATDFCEPARRALGCARQLAQARGAAVCALHVMDLTKAPAAERRTASYNAARDSAERMLRDIRRELRLAGVKESATLAAAGRPSRAIRETAEQRGAGMIALGLNGARSRRASTLGATARALLRQAPCPVLTVGTGVPEVPSSRTAACWCQRAMYITDTHVESLRAAMAVWPPATDAEKAPVWAVLPPGFDEDLPGGLDPSFAAARRLPLTGAALTLLHEAAERGAGVMVLALRTGEYLDSFASGSLGHALATGAACPVLTVRG